MGRVSCRVGRISFSRILMEGHKRGDWAEGAGFVCWFARLEERDDGGVFPDVRDVAAGHGYVEHAGEVSGYDGPNVFEVDV